MKAAVPRLLIKFEVFIHQNSKRLAKPFYCKTILQIVSAAHQTRESKESNLYIRNILRGFSGIGHFMSSLDYVRLGEIND